MSENYQEWRDNLLSDGYVEAGVVNEIDRKTVEDDPKYNKCEECGSLLRYEGWITRGSYRALAICTNSDCDNCFEF